MTKKGSTKNPFEAAKRPCLEQLPSATYLDLQKSKSFDEKVIEINAESATLAIRMS